MRDSYEKSLAALNANLLKMGTMIETAIASAVTALRQQDLTLAQKTMQQDYEIDSMEKEIAGQCFSLLLLQQPVASDLRIVTAACRIISDMERIGDHAADISEIVLSMDHSDYLPYLGEISSMAENAIRMLSDSVDSYIRQDMSLVSKVRSQDDIVDALFVQAGDSLAQVLQAHPDASKRVIDLIMIAKYFERIGDHSVNIVNWTEFCKTGYYKSAKII
jgi:phosphate transport system protein